ncbi:MAG: DUF1285 domain-containing protein [Firmicutes bacterium HGW-Firmicutes-15]|nr:MAG: DUF1285 domain-containing protein [Firmicutes bacterium HGW-Firmicutes-15]
MDVLIQDITIKENGKWYFGQAEMFRRQILNVLATNLHRNPDGSYYIQMGDDENPVIVEDVPYLATGIMENEKPIKLAFHDLQEMILDHELKLYFKGDVPYITFRHEADTRLSRGVYWKLSDYFEFREEEVFIVPPK